jgi:hypothetical protein
MHWTLRWEDGSRRSVLPGMLASARGARRAPRRPLRPGGGWTAARGACRPRLRLARALMLTPWFTASAGIVIAAALAVDSPAALTYVPNAPGVRCPASSCAGSAPSQPDVATASPGVRLKTGPAPGTATSAGPGHRHVAGAAYQLGYQVVRHWQGGFAAMITLPGDLPPGPWSLRLAFPSARVDQVWGAIWQPSGDGGAGTATGSWPPVRGHDRDIPGLDGGPGLDARQLVIFATGRPTRPSGCSLDGARCDFGR